MRENLFKPFFLLILLLAAAGSPVLSQGLTVTGTVKDETAAMVPGATILVKGTTVGTNTDAIGAFSIRVPDQASILVISAVGYVAQEITVGQKSPRQIPC